MVHHTQVFHRVAACMALIGRTRLDKLEDEVDRLKRELRYTEEDLGAARTQLVRDEQARGQRIRDVEARAKSIERVIDSVSADNRSLRAQTVDLTGRLGRRTTERDEAIAQRDAARREAALHQTIQGAPARAPEVAPPATEPLPQQEEKDASVIRFELLELS